MLKEARDRLIALFCCDVEGGATVTVSCVGIYTAFGQQTLGYRRASILCCDVESSAGPSVHCIDGNLFIGEQLLDYLPVTLFRGLMQQSLTISISRMGICAMGNE